jgi:hypothetical protein
MDVHPTKNVSIGIDPYPCEKIGICSSHSQHIYTELIGIGDIP